MEMFPCDANISQLMIDIRQRINCAVHRGRCVRIYGRPGPNADTKLTSLAQLTDSDGENGETETWLDFARDCGYLP